MSQRAPKAKMDGDSMPPPAKDRSRKDAAPRLTGLGNAARAALLNDQAGNRAVPPQVRARMEHSLGVDLAGIRVHDDSASRNAAESLNAEAFVNEGQIHWGASAPQLESEAGAPLLAHEITHVVQQREAQTIEARVSSRGEASEAQAGVAAGRGLAGQQASAGHGGAVAATQRQPKADAAGKVDTQIAQEMVAAYLRKVATTKPPQNLKKAKVVRDALRKLAFSAGPQATLVDVDQFVDADSTPNDPVGMARVFVGKVPRITKAALDALAKAPFIDPQESTISRVVDVVKKSGAGGPDTDPVPGYVSPQDKAQDIRDKADAMTGHKSPPTYGPVAVDVLQLWRIGQGTKKELHAKPTKAAAPEAESYPAVEAVIQKIPKDALVPSDAKGKGKTDEGDWADSQEFARDLANRLDIAQKSNQDTISVNLGDNYAGVKDREGLRNAVEAIITKIRQALPHHAVNVKYAEVRTGRNLLTRGRVDTP